MESVPYVLEKKVCDVTVGYSILYMSVRSGCLIVLFKPPVSLLILCQVILSITESGVMKSPRIIELFLPSVLQFRFCFIYFDGLILGACLYICY